MYLTSYTITEALPITSRVKLINQKKSAKIAMDKNSKTFVVYMVVQRVEILILPFQVAQIADLL